MLHMGKIRSSFTDMGYKLRDKLKKSQCSTAS